MTPQEILDLLDEVKSVLDPSKEIDKDNEIIKRFVKAYRSVTGKSLGTGNCKNCIMDAYFEWKSLTEKELIFMTMERKYKLKSDRVVGFNNNHYTVANITDEIAIQMVSQNPNHSKSFENGEELLSALETGGDFVIEPKKRGRKPKQ